MKELKGRELLLVGFTLFSMFFGAGNLIFPPFTGAQAGTSTWIAFVRDWRCRRWAFPFWAWWRWPAPAGWTGWPAG